MWIPPVFSCRFAPPGTFPLLFTGWSTWPPSLTFRTGWRRRESPLSFLAGQASWASSLASVLRSLPTASNALKFLMCSSKSSASALRSLPAASDTAPQPFINTSFEIAFRPLPAPPFFSFFTVGRPLAGLPLPFIFFQGSSSFFQWSSFSFYLSSEGPLLPFIFFCRPSFSFYFIFLSLPLPFIFLMVLIFLFFFRGSSFSFYFLSNVLIFLLFFFRVLLFILFYFEGPPFPFIFFWVLLFFLFSLEGPPLSFIYVRLSSSSFYFYSNGPPLHVMFC